MWMFSGQPVKKTPMKKLSSYLGPTSNIFPGMYALELLKHVGELQIIISIWHNHLSSYYSRLTWHILSECQPKVFKLADTRAFMTQN